LEGIEKRRLSPVEAGEQRMGSKPLLSLIDENGRKYVLKRGDLVLMAAEETAYEMRVLGGRPALPARVATVEIAELGRVEGLVKPYLEFDPSTELEVDTSSWSELQRNVMLAEHAWEWFLDNLDTNTSQYALIGAEAFPVNVDWDRAFASDFTSELSRFAKYKATLPNARTFLYADYVEGRIDLPFSLLRREARRIRKLPVRQVERITEIYAVRRFGASSDARAFVNRVIKRQSQIEAEFQRLIKSLLRERLRLNATTRNAGDLVRNIRAILWNDLQIVLNYVLRGPVGRFSRWMLKQCRGRLLGASRSTNTT
jgi:hypothetical protein